MSNKFTRESLAEILKKANQPRIHSLLEDDEAMWKTIKLDIHSVGMDSPMGFINIDATLTTVSWTWHTKTQGARPCVASIISITSGGLSPDGWATQEYIVIPIRISAAEAVVCARLAANSALPVYAGHTNL